MISGYVFILPAMTAICWSLAWRRSWRLRLGVLAAAAIISVLCYFIAFQVPGGLNDPAHGCPLFAECGSSDRLYWLEAAVINLGCVILLMVVTSVVGAIRLITHLLLGSTERRSV